MAERAGKLLRPLPWPGAQLGSVARRQARRPDRAGCPWPCWCSRPLRDLDCGRLPAREAGQARRTPGGGAERGLGPAGCGRLPSELRGDRTLAAPPASPHWLRPPARDLLKGLALFSLRSSPASEASVHPSAHSGVAASAPPSVRTRGTGGPGSWRQMPVPSLYPFVRGGRATHS